jgi:hypothetical protein
MHGEGTVTGADGSKYVGQWKDDAMHGFGTSFFADGTIDYQGEWENDHPVDRRLKPHGSRILLNNL